MNFKTTLQPRQRTYLSNEFKLTVWSKVKPYFDELLRRSINSVEELEQWVLDRSELVAVLREEFNWRYIKVSCDTNDQDANALYEYGIQKLVPKISPIENQLNEKLLNCEFTPMLPKDKYFIHLRSIRNHFEIYQEENIPLFSEEKMLSKKHGEIFSKMMVNIDDKDYTIQQASSFLERPDSELRQQVYRKMVDRISKDGPAIESLLSELIKLRHQIAVNAGFHNYRDFKFKSLGRFDYSPQDCFNFHQSIENEIRPIVEELNLLRKKEMNLDELRPWDLSVDPQKRSPLQPFESVNEMVEKSIECLHQVNPFFGKSISIMKEMGHLDLESRKAKRPGGYNMPLPISGAPFIFMNAAGTFKDVCTMLHESGHAVHSFLMHPLKLNTNKKTPSEVAELAAMTMELITMETWDVFFDNKEDLRRAKIWQLKKAISVLPWIASIDKFQHWMYTSPNHSVEERTNQWLKIHQAFGSSITNWEGLETPREQLWYRQLHIFEVPFYYIEYGFAQLGAIAIWKNFKENPNKTIQQYINALELGYTKPIEEIYKTAGIEFNFSEKYVRELGIFVKKELRKLIPEITVNYEV